MNSERELCKCGDKVTVHLYRDGAKRECTFPSCPCDLFRPTGKEAPVRPWRDEAIDWIVAILNEEAGDFDPCRLAERIVDNMPPE